MTQTRKFQMEQPIFSHADNFSVIGTSTTLNGPSIFFSFLLCFTFALAKWTFYDRLHLDTHHYTLCYVNIESNQLDACENRCPFPGLGSTL